MPTPIRLAVAVVTALATYFFTFWIGGALILGLDGAAIGAMVLAAIVSILATRFVWRASMDARGFFGTVCTGAVVTGAIAFCAGFFGPLIFAPGANQGPLLGLFITGPLGFIAGGIGGGIYWAVRRGRDGSHH